MLTTQSRFRAPPLALCALLLAAIGCLHACASSTPPEQSAAAPHLLKPADFANAPAVAQLPESTKSQTAQAPTPPSTPAALPIKPAPVMPETLQIGEKPARKSPAPADQPPDPAPAPTIVATPGLPVPSVNAQPVDHPLVVDAVVGQINGKPVFASEILEPLDGRLRALSEQTKSRAEFNTSAEKLIVEELRRRIQEELALSEARAGLTPEVRAGLFHIINEIRDSLVSQQHGSQVAADESFRESQGRSLDDQAKQMLDRELIQNELRQRVMPRVQVTWRDIQQEYERDYDKYHPKATARLRIIQVSGPANQSNEQAAAKYHDSLASIDAGLKAQTSFEALASQPPNEFLRSKGGLLERQLAGEYAEGEFSSIPEINAAARELTPGKWSGPITYTDADDHRERTAWIYLETINRPQAQSLEDVQLEIEKNLQEKRTQRELAKYLNSLSSRGNVSDIKVMTTALTDIAIERYVPPSRK